MCEHRDMNNIQKSSYGSVRPYTRHTADFPFAKVKDYSGCNCPKWIYVRDIQGKRERYSLVTPS